jgi:hypothetical protein
MISLGGPGFKHRVVNDRMAGLLVAIDAAALNRTDSAGVPIGLFRRSDLARTTPASDTGNGGEPA